MNMNDYHGWKKQIKNFMLEQGETLDFINFVHDWFDGMGGAQECALVQDFHPEFKNKSNNQISDFIQKVRFLPAEFSDTDWDNQNFNSAFLLYRPLLKLKYLKEKNEST